MDGRQDRNGLLGDIDTREDSGGLRDTRESLVEDLWWQVAELEVDVVLLRTNTTALANFDGHGTRDDVTRCEILRRRRITLHEPLTLRVKEVSTLTTRTYARRRHYMHDILCP